MEGATDKTATWQMTNRSPDGGLLVAVGCSTLASAALLTSILLYNGALGQVERGQLLRVGRYLARYVWWR